MRAPASKKDNLAEPDDEMMRDFLRRVAPVLLDISQISVWSLNRLGQVADSLHEQHTADDVIRIPPIKD